MMNDPADLEPTADDLTSHEPADVARLREHVTTELRDAATYRVLADQVVGEPRRILLELAEGEERHARQWADVLESLGEEVPTLTPGPRLRARALGWMVTRRGIAVAVPFLERQELAEERRYQLEDSVPHGLLGDEADHAAALDDLAPKWRTRISGVVRAAVFGVSDGVVSNLALILGVLGAGTARAGVVIAGLAGLLAGALSMAAGEYVSVASQRELLEADGESADVIEAVGSAVGAAVTSFGTFSFGAFVPLLPFLVASGVAAAAVASVLSAVLLAGIGATLALFTRRSIWKSALRQAGLGLGAGALTLVIGNLVGIGI